MPTLCVQAFRGNEEGSMSARPTRDSDIPVYPVMHAVGVAPRMSALWTTREVAEFLNVSPETVLRRYRAFQRGEAHGLPGFPIGSNAIRFDPDEVRAWLSGTRPTRTLASVREEA